MSEEEIRSHLYDVYAGEDWDFLTNYIMNLQQENQQLKERHYLIQDGRGNCKTLVLMLQKENEKYKLLLDEIREYINNYDVFKEFSFPLMKRDEENQVKSSIDYEFKISIKKSLLQILDKVKE